jgi:hypothetical protein
MHILFLSDDPDDATIFLDAIYEINPELLCMVMASNENTLVAFNETELSTVFLDYNNLPERFVKNFIKDLRDHEQLNKINVIIYASPNLLTREIHQQLINLGITRVVLKTSDLIMLRKSITDSLK